MILIPIEDQAYYLVPAIFAIGIYVHSHCERGAVKGISKKLRRTHGWHAAFWFGMLGLLGATLLFIRT